MFHTVTSVCNPNRMLWIRSSDLDTVSDLIKTDMGNNFPKSQLPHKSVSSSEMLTKGECPVLCKRVKCAREEEIGKWEKSRDDP